MSDKCDVDGCENDAHSIWETKDDNGKLIAEKIFCKEHNKSFIFGEIDE
jgi:hypothetical protein